MNQSQGNRLRHATSPYLRQHAANPVDWYPWGDEAFGQAKQRDVPIFLSIGYSTCHWCHVMARESFSNAEVAQYLNQHFVAIKVDREERPDVDHIYMDALLSMQGQGGWPMSLFLTHEGKPFFGGTYFPVQPRFGYPGFLQVLQRIVMIWQDQREEIVAAGNHIYQILQQQYTIPSEVTSISFMQISQHTLALQPQIDWQQGGLKGSQKFPQIPLWRHLLVTARFLSHEQLQLAALLTANRLIQGGIYDHIGGGWMRYTVDAQWLVPHFEKMLYDNAQLIQWFSELQAIQANASYKIAVSATIDWLLREMQTEEHLFACALDAESEGVEGKYYVWDANEMTTVLGDDAPLAQRIYGVTVEGNWEGRNILQRDLLTTVDADEALKLQTINQKLLAYRMQRQPPSRDDKVLTDWNALLISALVSASHAFSELQWQVLATSLFANLLDKLYVDQQLYHSYCAQTLGRTALLDDYANLIAAALDLYAATNEQHYCDYAITLTAQANQLYYDNSHGYYTLCSIDSKLITNPVRYQDNSVPCGNGTMAVNLVRLYYITANTQYYETVQRQLIVFSKVLCSNYAPFCGGLAYAQGLLECAILFHVKAASQDDLLVRYLKTHLPVFALVHYQLDPAVTTASIMICEQQQCLPPINTLDKLKQFLEHF